MKKTSKAPAKKTNGFRKPPANARPMRTRCDGFFERVEGNTIQGILLGAFTPPEGDYGPRKCFKIRITEGETQVGGGELLGPGAVIGLDEKGYTKALAEVELGSEVWVQYEGQLEPEEVVNPKTGKKTVRQGAHVFNCMTLVQEEPS